MNLFVWLRLKARHQKYATFEVPVSLFSLFFCWTENSWGLLDGFVKKKKKKRDAVERYAWSVICTEISTLKWCSNTIYRNAWETVNNAVDKALKGICVVARLSRALVSIPYHQPQHQSTLHENLKTNRRYQFYLSHIYLPTKLKAVNVVSAQEMWINTLAHTHTMHIFNFTFFIWYNAPTISAHSFFFFFWSHRMAYFHVESFPPLEIRYTVQILLHTVARILEWISTFVVHSCIWEMYTQADWMNGRGRQQHSVRCLLRYSTFSSFQFFSGQTTNLKRTKPEWCDQWIRSCRIEPTILNWGRESQ